MKLSSVITLVSLFFSQVLYADNCLDVFPDATNENASHSLNLLANDGSGGHLIRGSNQEDSYSSGEHFYLSGQLSGNYQLHAPDISARMYFTSLNSSGNTSINTENSSQTLIIIVDGDIELAGNTTYKAIIYATGNVSISGNTYINGAVTALGSITTQGNASVSYNQAAIEQADFAQLCDSSGSSGNSKQFAFGTTNSGSVHFEQAFTQTPVVILMPTIRENNTNNDGPANVRLNNVSTTGFSFSQQEPPGNNIGSNTMAEVHWMAFAPGKGSLPDGHPYEAGFSTINNYQAKSAQPSVHQQHFSSSFSSPPEVFHQQQTQLNDCWLSSTVTSINNSYFELALELSEVFDSSWGSIRCAPGNIKLPPEQNDKQFTPETVGWVASPAHIGSYTENGNQIVYEIGQGQNHNKSGTKNLNTQCAHHSHFTANFSHPPIFIAKKISRIGGDGGWLRRCKLNEQRFSAVVDEDQYQDDERKHLKEAISYFAISSSTHVNNSALRIEDTQSEALSCEPHPISVQALLDGQADETYTGSINLNSSSATGTWALISGSGSFNSQADTGSATYTFSANDKGRATFSLFHPQEGLTNITASDGPVSDELAITFRAFAFRSSLDNQVGIYTANIDSQIKLWAVGKDESQTGCSVINNYAGDKNIHFWASHLEPTSVSTQLEVNGSPIANEEANASSQVINFTAGQALLTLNYPNAGQIKLNTKDAQGIAPPSSGGTGGAIIGGSTFIVNPYAFYIHHIIAANNKANPQGSANTATTGSGFTAAGENFQLKLSAVMQKGSRNCPEIENSGYCLTNAFEHSSIRLNHKLLSPEHSSAQQGSLLGQKELAMSSGQQSFTGLSFSEVGSINISALAKDYFITGNDIQGSSPEIGRFYPHHIELIDGSVIPSCQNFSYLDQEQVLLSYHLQANNLNGQRTYNYHEPQYKVVASLNEYAGDGSNDLSLRLLSPSNAASWQQGLYAINNKNTGIGKLSTPDGPFKGVHYALFYLGQDGESLRDLDFSLSDLHCQQNNSCNTKSLGNAGDFYYGRLSPVNGFGSELSPIRSYQRIEYFNSAMQQFFISNFDNCSLLNINDISLSPDAGAHSVQIGSGSSELSIESAQSGLLPLTFTAPGEGNTGVGNFTINLLNNLAWLRHDWDQDGNLDDSIKGSITFGIYKGSKRLIYKKEQGVN